MFSTKYQTPYPFYLLVERKTWKLISVVVLRAAGITRTFISIFDLDPDSLVFFSVLIFKRGSPALSNIQHRFTIDISRIPPLGTFFDARLTNQTDHSAPTPVATYVLLMILPLNLELEFLLVERLNQMPYFPYKV